MTGPVHKPGHLARGGWPSNEPRCDICKRWRNQGNHTACSKARKLMNEEIEAMENEQADPLRAELAQHFADLGAPLLHADYSTSALRQGDGAVFLMAWADHKRKIGGGLYPFRLLLGHAAQGERRVHVEALTGANPARGYLVVVSALDLLAKPRAVKTFNTGMVIPIGRVVMLDGDAWGECLPPVPVADVRMGQGEAVTTKEQSGGVPN